MRDPNLSFPYYLVDLPDKVDEGEERFLFLFEDFRQEGIPAWVAEQVRLRKEAGLWTDCDDKGHDLPSIHDMVCRRCNSDFSM